MNKDSIINKIIKLSRLQKEYFINNFDKIKNTLESEIKVTNFLKKANVEEDDLNTQIINIILKGLEKDNHSMSIIESYLGGDESLENQLLGALESSFSIGMEQTSIDNELQELYHNWFELLSSDPISIINEVRSKISSEFSIKEPEEELKGIDDISIIEEEKVSNNFSKVFGVDPEKVQISKGPNDTLYAVYKGVLNIPVDSDGNVLIDNKDIDFFKNTIDNYMDFFGPADTDEKYLPDQPISSEKSKSDIGSAVKELPYSTDPLTRKYKEFFELKAKHFNEAERLDFVEDGFSQRIVQVYNQITGSNEKSYSQIVEKYKKGELPINFNELNKITAMVKKRVFGQKLTKNEIELLGPLSARTQNDEELFKKTMSLKAADDFSNDYIGKMQKLYIGEKIGQDTHDRIMELGELIYGASLSSEGSFANDLISLADIVISNIVENDNNLNLNLENLLLPRSLRPRYLPSDQLHIPDESIPNNIRAKYIQDVKNKINEVKQSFISNEITDEETMKNYLNTLYNPESYSYYKHTAETTKHYQIQTELARLRSLNNKTTSTYWCSKCGRFRPEIRAAGGDAYIEYKDGNGTTRRTFNVAPSGNKYRKREIIKAVERGEPISDVFIPGGTEGELHRTDDIVTEYEKTLIGEDSLNILRNRCEFFSFGECDMARNFYPNLVKPKAKEGIDPLSYWGFVPLRLFGEDINKIDLEDYNHPNQVKDFSKDRRAFFPKNYSDIIDKFYNKMVNVLGEDNADEIKNNIKNVVSFMASISEVSNVMSSVLEKPDHPINEHINSCKKVLEYITQELSNSSRGEEIRALVAELKQSKNGQWIDEESILNLEALRDFVSLFGFDGYSRTFLSRLNKSVDYPLVEASFDEHTGLHSLLINNNITDVPLNDIAMLSSPAVMASNPAVQNFIRKMTISRFLPYIDETEIGLLDPNIPADQSLIVRDDKEIFEEIIEILEMKPIKVPKMDIIFQERFRPEYSTKGKEKKYKEARLPLQERYEKFLNEFDINDYDPEEIEEMDMYFYGVPTEQVIPHIWELIDEYRKLHRDRGSLEGGVFDPPYSGLDRRRNFLVQSNPKKRLEEHAKKLSVPWVSATQDISEADPEKRVLPAFYPNISWFAKQYQRALSENPTSEMVTQKYAEIGIEGKEVEEPVLDLALLYITNLENSRIAFTKEPESNAVRKELEIAAMKNSLREECRSIYMDSHPTPQKQPKGRGIYDFEEKDPMIVIAGTIMGEDPIYLASTPKGKRNSGEYKDIYNKIKNSPIYEMVNDLIMSSKTDLVSEVLGMADAEIPIRFQPAFGKDLSDEGDKLQFREQQKRYTQGHTKHSTALHDSLVKYLISPKEISDAILRDLAQTGAYLEGPVRQLISTIYLRSIQGPNMKQYFTERPFENTLAYHAKNAGTGYFEPLQYNIFTNSSDVTGAPALIKILTQGKRTNWVVGDLPLVIDATGSRGHYGRSSTGKEKGMEPSRQMRNKLKQDKEANKKNWYKKAQTIQNSNKKLIINDVLFLSDRDIINTVRNISYSCGGGAPVRPVLPKIFIRPFSDFKSLTALKKYMRQTGLKAIPITPEGKDLLQRMGMRLS